MTITRRLREKVKAIKFSTKSLLKSQYVCSSTGKVNQDRCIQHLYAIPSEKGSSQDPAVLL